MKKNLPPLSNLWRRKENPDKFDLVTVFQGKKKRIKKGDSRKFCLDLWQTILVPVAGISIVRKGGRYFANSLSEFTIYIAELCIYAWIWIFSGILERNNDYSDNPHFRKGGGVGVVTFFLFGVRPWLPRWLETQVSPIRKGQHIVTSLQST